MSKLVLATVPKTRSVKKPCPKPKPKKDTEISPRVDMITHAAFRMVCAVVGCVVFVFEFFAGGFEGACRASLAFMQGKEKKIG